MKKEELSPMAQNILDMMISTENVNLIADFYDLPPELRMRIIESTTTVEERNIEIIRLCIMFYAAGLFKLDDPDKVHEMIIKNFVTIMDSFLNHMAKLILMNRESKFKATIKELIEEEKL